MDKHAQDFTNVLKKSSIELLAEADAFEVVKEVQEFFSDYIPITSSHFSLNLDCPPQSLWSRDSFRNAASGAGAGTSGRESGGAGGRGSGGYLHEWDADSLERHTQGLLAVLLSLKKKPVIRYERMSGMARRLGEEVVYQMTQAQPTLFDLRRTENAPVLLLLDRRNDPVTPLLTQWTYQAMVHELLDIRNGRVNLDGAEGVRSELKEIVLSADQDPFFRANLYDNFGDLGASIKQYVTDYQSRTSSNSRIETVQDMKRFVEEYPEFRKLGGNVSKHVALLGELSRLVEKGRMLEVSELEQSLASNESHSSDLQSLEALLEATDVEQEAKLRLAILYALRYQRSSYNQIPKVVEKLLSIGVPESRVAVSMRGTFRCSGSFIAGHDAHSHLCTPCFPSSRAQKARLRHAQHRRGGPAAGRPVRERGPLLARQVGAQGPQGRRERLHAALAPPLRDAREPHARAPQGRQLPLCRTGAGEHAAEVSRAPSIDELNDHSGRESHAHLSRPSVAHVDPKTSSSSSLAERHTKVSLVARIHTNFVKS